MKVLNRVLLGSAVGFCVVTSANAADLPSVKSAPVEYVRVCSEAGQGFFYLPGSDTCVQIGGRVRADTAYIQTNSRNNDAVNFSASARINLDVRTNTPYGLARAYLRYNLGRADGNYGDGFNNGTTGTSNYGGLDLAYIQFAGLTAGRIQSFFDFYANNYNFATIRNSDVNTQVLAYTANFGGGWSLTLGIEDGSERRVYSDNSYLRSYGIASAGQSVPDVVGALLVEQDWGSAQLSAALHQIRPVYVTGVDGYYHDTKYGFAVHGGVKFNLSSLAPGSELWIEGAYADGAIGYLGAGSYGFTQGGVALPMTDAFIDANGRMKKAKGWSAMVDLLHYWTPSVRQNIFASYMQLEYGRGGYTTYSLPELGTFNVGFVDANEWRIGSNIIWSPIKNFDIGAEVLYTRLDPKNRVLSDNAKGGFKAISSDDSWQGRLRVQRDF
ncbi:porin [Microvirga sp. W0021]|uniref:Porin n=1 Tax=Hohaiivirga grylli TaxID=3133970 RepID=A0ABV0BK27_9HYPH